MDDNDPITQFFPGEEDVNLYAVLSLEKDAPADSIKKSYRKLALLYHPDKHANSSKDAKDDALTKFQQIGFAYAVLSDDKRKARYDSTGKTDEGFDFGAGDDGWETYFEELFDRVTREKLDEMKAEYQGSAEEIEDLKQAYNNNQGDLGEIMNHIPHSTHEDESRFITVITALIKKKELKSTKTWTSSSKDEIAKMVRKKESKKEAKEAEELAKELGVWDEFYGTGKTTERKKGKAKSQATEDGEDAEDEDHSALQALILRKNKDREAKMDSFFDSLAAKYAEPAEGKKNKGRKRGLEEGESMKKKKRRA